MPTQTPIAEVVAVIGDVQVQRAGGGEPVALNPGDVLYPGDKVLAEPGQTVELSMSDGQTLMLDSGTPVTIAADMLQDTAPGRDEAAVEGESIDELIAALESGEGVDDLLEETAAGAAGDDGNSFVILNRIAEGIPREARAEEAAAVEETDVVEDEDPVIPESESEPEPENNPPEFRSGEDEPGGEPNVDVYDFGSLPEGSQSGDEVGTIVADDADNDTLTYCFKGGSQTNGVFTIDPETGVITLNQAIDDADLGEFELEVKVTDGNGGEDTATVFIDLTNVNDPPEFRSGEDQAGDAPNVDVYDFGTLPEGSSSGTEVGTIIADDADLPGDTLTYSFADDSQTDGVFSLDSSTGVITLNQAIDDADLGEFSLDVKVTDGQGGTDTATVLIDLTNENDPPEFRSGEDQAGDAPNVDVYDFGTLPEGSTSGTEVGTIIADDADLPGDTLTYSFADDSQTDGVFSLDSSTGVITLNQAIDDADLGEFSLDVKVTDGQGGTDTATVLIDLTNENDPPEFRSGNDQAGDAPNVDVYDFGTLPEGSTSGTEVGTIIADDADLPGDTLTYSFADDSQTDGVFSLDSSTGVITLNQAIDDADLGEFSLDVKVTDGQGGTDTATVLIDLTNVDDPSTFGSVTPAAVDEANLPLGTDPDEPALTDSTGNFIVINDVDGVTSIQMKGVDDWVEVVAGGFVNTEHGQIEVTGISDQGGGVYHLNYEFTLATTVDNPTPESFEAADSVLIRSGDSGAGQSIDVATIQDDTPVFTADKADEVDGSNDFNPDLSLNLVSADEFGSSSFTVVEGTAVTDVDTNPVTANGEPLFYFYGDVEQTILLAKTAVDGDTAFTLVLDQSDGSYNFTTNMGIISNGTATLATDLSGVGGGNSGAKGLFNLEDPNVETSSDVLLTTTAGSVNTNNTTIGNGDGQSLSDGEDVRMTIVSDLEEANNEVGFAWGDYVEIFTFKQEVDVTGNANNRADFTLTAYLEDTDNVLGTDPITLLVGYISILDENGEPVDIDGEPVTVVQNVDGKSIDISGFEDGWTYVINTPDDNQFNSVQVTASQDTDTFKLKGFSFGDDNLGEPIEINVALQVADGDGDIANGTLTATIHPKIDGLNIVDGDSQTDDDLVGTAGDDYILGYDGDDTLTGGEGSDTFTGGLGADVFVWELGDGDLVTPPTDTVTDFGNGADVLDLSDLLVGETEVTLGDYLSFVTDGTDTTISVSSAGDANVDQTIVLENVDLFDVYDIGGGEADIISGLLNDSKLIITE